MTKFNVRKQFAAALTGVALTFGATQALADVAPFFTYDLDGVPGGTTIVANGMSGTSAEVLQAISPTQFAGYGWVQFSALTNNSAAIGGTSYANTGLYAVFTLQDTVISLPPPFGGLGQPNSFYNINSMTVSLFYDTNKNNSFSQALAQVFNTGDDQLLMTATLTPGTGTAALYPAGGVGLNARYDVAGITAAGTQHFISPAPFYDHAFAGFSSTGGSYTYNPITGTLTIGNATGAVDFVPEPATLALLGLGLLGLGAKRRMQKAA